MFAVTLNLQLFIRTGLHTKFVKLWDALKLHYGKCLQLEFEDQPKLPLLNFCRGYVDELKLFMDGETFDHIVQSIVKDIEPSEAVLRNALAGHPSFAVIFAKLATKLNFSQFLKAVATELDTLEFLDFSLDSVNDFNRLMKTNVDNLIKTGYERFKKLNFDITFCNSKLTMRCLGPADIPAFAFESLVRSIAVQRGDVKLLPWEEVLFETGKIDNVPSTFSVPERFLEKCSNARDTALSYLKDGSYDRATLAQIKKELMSHYKDLVQMDRFFVIELSFMNLMASDLIIDKIKAKVIDLLPNGVVEFKMATVPK